MRVHVVKLLFAFLTLAVTLVVGFMVKAISPFIGGIIIIIGCILTIIIAIRAKVGIGYEYYKQISANDKKREEKIKKEAQVVKKKTEDAKKVANKTDETKKKSKIGETISYSTNNGDDYDLTIDSVALTNELNEYSEEFVNNVVKIDYTVKNKGSEPLSFFLDSSGTFYNSDNFQEDTYSDFSVATTDIMPGQEAKGTEYVGITNKAKYLEFDLGDTILGNPLYQWADIK